MAGLAPDSPVSSLKGIKTARAADLALLGIRTVRDLLYYFPRRYIDRSSTVSITELESLFEKTLEEARKSSRRGEPRTPTVTVGGIIVSKSASKGMRPFGKSVVRLLAVNSGTEFEVVFFNQYYLRHVFEKGRMYFFSGRAGKREGRFVFVNPAFDSEYEKRQYKTGGLIGVYSLTGSLMQKTFKRLIEDVLEKPPEGLERLPQGLAESEGLMPVLEAFREMHFPTSPEKLEEARKRFAFEEFYFLKLSLMNQSRLHRKSTNVIKTLEHDENVKRVIENLPFQLTESQKRSLIEIETDLVSEKPMLRLLSGDVGSGKTLVAFLSMLRVAENGYQAALMVPTEVLASQHFFNLKRLLAQTDIRVELLTGGLSRTEKKRVLEAARNGTSSLFIGTHALLSSGAVFKSLAYVVVDEQHRFGVLQRTGLLEKSLSPNLLLMTATPIPRTLSLVLLDEISESRLEASPPGRAKVSVHVRDRKSLPDIFQFVRDEVRRGFQAYVVCPLISCRGDTERQSVTELYGELVKGPFASLRVGLLHGKMSVAERNEILGRFYSSELDVLVSTTVIEVGVDVSKATVMVVLDADSFGLAQLYQLRGRIGRSSYRSYCILVSSSEEPAAKARLKKICEARNGYELALADLLERGAGELLGLEQSGWGSIPVSAILGDEKIARRAFQKASELFHLRFDSSDGGELEEKRSASVILESMGGSRRKNTVAGGKMIIH